jgi:hypothetical protein
LHRGVDLEGCPQLALSSGQVARQDLHFCAALCYPAEWASGSDPLGQESSRSGVQLAGLVERAEHGPQVGQVGQHPRVFRPAPPQELLTGEDALVDRPRARLKRHGHHPLGAELLPGVPGAVRMGQPPASDLLHLAWLPPTKVNESKEKAGLRQAGLFAGRFEHRHGLRGLIPHGIQADRVRAGGQPDPCPLETEEGLARSVGGCSDPLQQLRQRGVGVVVPPHHLVNLSELAPGLPSLWVVGGKQRLRS